MHFFFENLLLKIDDLAKEGLTQFLELLLLFLACQKIPNVSQCYLKAFGSQIR